MKKYYYYLVETLDQGQEILKEGIRSDENGWIYFITEFSVIPNIASYQYGMGDAYGVIRVDEDGILSAVEDFDCGDGPVKDQKEVYQSYIAPEYLTWAGMYKYDGSALNEGRVV